MDISGYNKVKTALDNTLGNSSVTIEGAPEREGETVIYVSIKPTGYSFDQEPAIPYVAQPHEILGALAAAGFMADTGQSKDTPDAQTPQFIEKGLYIQPSTSQFDNQYTQVLLKDLNV